MLKKIKDNLKTPRALVTFVLILLATFLFDGLTKHFIFDNQDLAPLDGKYGSDFVVIGLKSLPHDNSTIFSSLKFEMDLWARIFINILIAVAFTVPILFTRSIFVAIGLGILVGGILGNGLDIIAARTISAGGIVYSHYVRDIFYTPWANEGVFNAADVFIIVGAGLIFIRTIITLFKKEN